MHMCFGFRLITLASYVCWTPLSTEEDETPKLGLVPEHFAYRVDGARFARLQSEAWKQMSGPVAHYQFVTEWACMDVLSGGSPSFSIVARVG